MLDWRGKWICEYAQPTGVWFPYWQKARSPQAGITGIAVLLQALQSNASSLQAQSIRRSCWSASQGSVDGGNDPWLSGCPPHRCCFMSLQMELKNFLWDLQGEGVEVRDVRDIFSYNALLAVTIIVYFKETGSKICSVSGAFLCLLNWIF